MKKLVVLMLVVGMASLASAAFTLTGSTSVDAGSSQSIGIYNDTASAPQEQFYLAMTVAGTVGSWNGANAQYAPPGVTGTPGNVYYGTAVDPTIDVWYANTSNGVPTDYFDVGTLADFGLDAVAVGTVGLTLLDFGFNVLDTMTITVTDIPEPMTMALLGLGGLFLRRKK